MHATKLELKLLQNHLKGDALNKAMQDTDNEVFSSIVLSCYCTYICCHIFGDGFHGSVFI